MNKLNEVFGIPMIEVVHPDDQTTVIPPEGNNEEDVDFDVARANHYQLLSQTTEAVGIAMRILRETEDFKAVQAVSGMLKTASEINKQLLNLNHEKADIKQKKNGKNVATPNTQIQANNVVFTGSSAELNKLLKGDQ